MGLMAKTAAVIVAMILVFIQYPAHCSPTTPPGQDIDITSSSSNIQSGFTKDLDINCTFKQDLNSQFGFLSSLILSKTSSPQDSDFTEIAAINAIHPDTVTSTSSLGADVTGELNSRAESFVSFHWRYPPNDVQGQYKCTAYGLDKNGHPISATATTVVREKTVDLAMILEKMKLLELNQENLITKLNKTQQELNKTETSLTQTKQKLNNTETSLTQTKEELNKTKAEQIAAQIKYQNLLTLESRLNSSLSLLFYNSTTFGNHKYYISGPSYTSILEASSVCAELGGYVVEINSQQEYDVIVKLIQSNSWPNYSNRHTMIGISDNVKEGEWRFVHSGGVVNFTKWASGEPSGAKYNCAYISYSDWLMYDFSCLASWFRFVCEVE